MKKSKEYKISIVLSCIALVLFGVSLVTGLMPELLDSNIDKITMYLGFASLGIGYVFLGKAKGEENKDK